VEAEELFDKEIHAELLWSNSTDSGRGTWRGFSAHFRLSLWPKGTLLKENSTLTDQGGHYPGPV